jgi:hypothetical protein
MLVPLDSTAETSNTPASKSIVIRIKAAEHIVEIFHDGGARLGQ